MTTWEDVGELVDYAVQGNYDRRQLHDLRASSPAPMPVATTKVKTDANNNEARFLVGVMTTFPWGD